MQLNGRIAIITGADSGIGQAAAEAQARAGAHIAVSYHTDAAGAEETRRRVEATGRKAFVSQSDIGDPASVTRLFEGCGAALGTPDILIANAGVAMSGMPVAEVDDSKFEEVIRTDLMGRSTAPAPSSRHGATERAVASSSSARSPAISRHPRVRLTAWPRRA